MALTFLASRASSARDRVTLAEGKDTPSALHSTGMLQSRLPANRGSRAGFFVDFETPRIGGVPPRELPSSGSSMLPAPGLPPPLVMEFVGWPVAGCPSPVLSTAELPDAPVSTGEPGSESFEPAFFCLADPGRLRLARPSPGSWPSGFVE